MNPETIFRKTKKALPFSFYLLFFLVPLVLYPKTSELFEFNKMLVTYFLTSLILLLWIVKMVSLKRKVFRRTVMDLPLIVFLITQALSTIISIDPRSSFFGYYSRFNGGLLSSISYSILYWAWVSNMNAKNTKRAINFLLSSAVLVSIYGVMEHFGIDKNIWVQDVQNRVFSTLGQPNWLAAFLVAISPFVWLRIIKKEGFEIKNKLLNKIPPNLVWFFVSILFFVTLIFTKSRSGFLAFMASLLVFLFVFILKILSKKPFKNGLRQFFILVSLLGITILLAGTPWTRGLIKISENKTQEKTTNVFIAPALEGGGTESGTIRKIVWKGAIGVWKKYPIFGSGVETFAFSYYGSRPVDHNLVSEWDFIYNKAHNEYLNYLATTGAVGFLAYLFFLFGILLSLITTRKGSQKSFSMAIENLNIKKLKVFQSWNLNIALIAGFLSILITNFFGFSVVIIAILTFLLPAFSITQNIEGEDGFVLGEGSAKYFRKNSNLEISGKLIILFSLLIYVYITIFLGKYFRADIFYNKGKLLSEKNPSLAQTYLKKALSYFPHEALYEIELSKASTNAALEKLGEDKKEDATTLAQESVDEYNKAIELSPNNPNLYRSGSIIYIKLASFSPDFLLNAKKEVEKAIELAPTDAKLYYNLGLTDARIGSSEDAKKAFEKAVELKPDYTNARFGLGLVLEGMGEKDKAIEQYEYILKNLEPNNSLVKQQLEQIK